MNIFPFIEQFAYYIMDYQDEEFKNIDDYPGYQISNYGRVKSTKYADERFLKTNLGARGFLRVWLSKNGKTQNFQCHRLVAENFLTVPGKEENLVISHIDRNKQNNHVSNLRWVTISEGCKNREVQGCIYEKLLKSGKYSYTAQIRQYDGSRVAKSFSTKEAAQAHLDIQKENYANKVSLRKSKNVL